MHVVITERVIKNRFFKLLDFDLNNFKGSNLN